MLKTSDWIALIGAGLVIATLATMVIITLWRDRKRKGKRDEKTL